MNVALLVIAVAAAILVAAIISRKARASDAGHVPGAGPLGHGGSATEGKSITDSDASDRRARLLRMKRELLEQWAKDGKEIDIVAEARAELIALDIDERGSTWRDYAAGAAGEPLAPERPFAS